MTVGKGLEGCSHEPRNAWSHQTLEDAGRMLPRASGGAGPRQNLAFGRLASSTGKNEFGSFEAPVCGPCQHTEGVGHTPGLGLLGVAC